MSKSGVSILSSKKKIDFLKPVKSASVNGLNITLLTRSQDDGDKANISKLISEFTSSGSGQTLGHFSKEKFESEFSRAVSAAFKAKAKETVDSSAFFSKVFAVKDQQEVQLLKRASDITCTVFSRHLKEKIMDVIDDDKVNIILSSVKSCVLITLNVNFCIFVRKCRT